MAIFRDGNSFGDSGTKAAEAGSVYTPGAPTPTTSNRLPSQGAAPTNQNLTAAKPVAKPADNTPALPSYDDYTSGRSSYDNYTRGQLQQSAGTGGAEQFPTEALQPIGTQAPITDQALADDSTLDYSDGQADPTEARIAELRAQTGSSKNSLISGLRSFQDFYQF